MKFLISQIVMVFFYYLLFTPIGIIRRILLYFQKSAAKKTTSYWQKPASLSTKNRPSQLITQAVIKILLIAGPLLSKRQKRVNRETIKRISPFIYDQF